MEAFLIGTKQKLSEDSAIHVVIGNEACDLDSAVSAIVYAYYLAQKSENGTVVPVLNINKEDYRLRTEVTFYLRKHGISEELLTFRDGVDLHGSHKNGLLKLTVVDFNVFHGEDVSLEDCVVEVIDHHQRERPEKSGVSVTLELVGSCCTLVAEKLSADSSFSMEQQIAGLLYGAIVLDTVCLAPEAGRTTPKDELIVKKLETMLSDVDRKKTFEELQAAKSDVSRLSIIDVLRKDLKKISSNNLSIAISSIPVKLETFLASDGVPQDVADFSDQQRVDVVVLMTLYITEDGAAHRQIAVYSHNESLRDQVSRALASSSNPDLKLSILPAPWPSVDAYNQANLSASRKKVTETLKSSQEPDLQLKPLPTTFDNYTSFNQNNLTGSRKKVLPLLQAFLNGDHAPDSALTSDGGVDLTSSVTSSLEQDSGIAPSDIADLLSPDSHRDLQNVTSRSQEPNTPEDIDDIGDLDFSLAIGGDNYLDSGLLDGFLEISPQPSSMSTPDRQLSHPATPPNTFSESHLEGYREHMLPSFNSLEMVKKIRDKKEMLEGAIGEDVGSGNEPYTPHNSVTDSSLQHYAREHNLPSFNNPETVTKIRKKRSDLDFEGGDDELKPGSVPFTPPNSYAESPMDGATASIWESGHDFLGRVEQEVRRRSVTGEMVITSQEEFAEIGPNTNVVAVRIAKNMMSGFGDHGADRPLASSEYAYTNPAFQNGYSPDDEALIYRGHNDMEVAYQIAQEIIHKALETYVSSLTQEELIEFSNRKYNGHKLETEYLSELDPFKGKPDLVGDMSVSTSRELAESESFNRLHSISDEASDIAGSMTVRGVTEGESSPDTGFRPALKLGGAVVTESSTVTERRPSGILKMGGATSGESSSDILPGVQDFLARLDPEGSESDDPVKAKHRLESARIIVDQAIKQACKIYQKELSLKMAEEDGDAEVLKRLKDQMPENGDPHKAPLTPPRKKKIMPNVDLLQDMGEDLSSGVVPISIGSSEPDILSVEDSRKAEDLKQDEIFTDQILGEIDWESDDEEKGPPVEPIPEYTAREEFDDVRSWRNVTIGDKQYRLDMKVIEPYKRVLSHGGYYGDGFNAIIVFAGCNLPDRGRRDYSYVMDNLFLYVISTLELLVVEDYMMVYFHGATPKQKMPSLRWLKRCYEMISRRLKKNLKSLLIVHPTLWLKTIVLMTKPFISSKFYSKIRYVKSLPELGSLIPMEYVYIPDEIRVYDAIRNNLPLSPSTSSTP